MTLTFDQNQLLRYCIYHMKVGQMDSVESVCHDDDADVHILY